VPPEVRAPGLFVQEGAVVGWTFGRPFDQGYVWPGTPAAGPLPAIGADKFFSAISSDCREGYFRRLFDSGVEKSPAAELEALAGGFRRAPLLAPEDLPPDLRQSAVVARMEALASDLIEGGQAAEVVRILDDQILRESADPVLAVAAVAAQAEGQDYNRTMRRLEAIERDVFAPRGLVPEEIRELKARLYKDWLRKIIEKGDYYSGQVAFEEALRAFPDDPEIRLLGVEIAISENDPARARELLADGDYPAELRERVERMGARLEEVSGDAQEEILIPFNPAADHISVEAVINGFYRQKFIVDTGANVVTIPAAAAQALGFTVDDTLPATTLLTAGGALHAYEVALGSIQLANLRVDKVKALVVDLPASPEHGLLGLNFFDAFRAEIDRANGVLRLKRRSP